MPGSVIFKMYILSRGSEYLFGCYFMWQDSDCGKSPWLGTPSFFKPCCFILLTFSFQESVYPGEVKNKLGERPSYPRSYRKTAADLHYVLQPTFQRKKKIRKVLLPLHFLLVLSAAWGS